MTPAPLAVVLLVGPDVPPEAAERSLGSIAAEAPGAPVAVLGDPATIEATPGLAGLAGQTTAPLAEAGELLAFLRLGDHWRPGGVAARERVLRARPEAGLLVGAHVIVDEQDRVVRRVPPPALPVDQTELLVRAGIEASAVVVRAARLEPGADELLTRPHGDLVLWSALACRAGVVPSDEIAAAVRLDPRRHGHDPRVRTAALLESVAAIGDAPGAPTLRRELLRRLYLDPAPEAVEVDLAATLLAAGAAPEAVVADLQWALERQREALAAERTAWPRGVIDPEESTGRFSDVEVSNLRGEVLTVTEEAVLRMDAIERLRAELQQRDLELDALRAARAGEGSAR